jgi:uncharacterized membrane protein
MWLRTNRLAGRLTVIGGLTIIAASFFPSIAVAVLLAVVAVIVVIPIVFSYFAYKQIEGSGRTARPASKPGL